MLVWYGLGARVYQSSDPMSKGSKGPQLLITHSSRNDEPSINVKTVSTECLAIIWTGLLSLNSTSNPGCLQGAGTILITVQAV